MSRYRCLLPCLTAAVFAGCGASPVNGVPADGLLALGTWGGDSAGVIVNDTIAHAHIGCTYGDIPGRVRLDADGRFTAAGSFLLRAYPVAVGPTMPAQFTGRVTGSTLTITVTVRDTIANTTVIRGPATSTLGTTPRMANCPICTVPGDRASGRRVPDPPRGHWYDWIVGRRQRGLIPP
jgi:hypothetical protein